MALLTHWRYCSLPLYRDNFVATCCNGSCQWDNVWCTKWWRSYRRERIHVCDVKYCWRLWYQYRSVPGKIIRSIPWAVDALASHNASASTALMRIIVNEGCKDLIFFESGVHFSDIFFITINYRWKFHFAPIKILKCDITMTSNERHGVSTHKSSICSAVCLG